jgi:integrase
MTTQPVPWRQFADEVLALYTPPIRRPATYRKTLQVLKEFSRLCRKSDDVTPMAIAKWIAAFPDRGDSTRLALLRHFRPACTYGATMGYLADPFLFRKPRKWLPASANLEPHEIFPRHRTAAEIRSVLEQADLEALGGRWEAQRLRALIYAYCFTGARKNEILGSLTADVDLGLGLLSIRGNLWRPLKTSASAARLPIPAPLATVLEAWLKLCGPTFLFPTTKRRNPWLHGAHHAKALDQIAQLGDRAGVKGLTILSLRHTFGTLCEGWGHGELMRQRLLRHARRDTQRGYAHEDLDQLRRAAAKIRYDDLK